MKAHPIINVVCQNEDCRQPYTVLGSQWENVRMMNLELAVCPWCQMPRTVNFYRRDVKQCPQCTLWKYLWAFKVRAADRMWYTTLCVTCRQGNADANYRHRAIDKKP